MGGRGRGRGTNPTWGSIPAPLDHALSGSQLLHGDTPPPFMFILQQGKHKGEGHLKGQRAKVRNKSKRGTRGRTMGKNQKQHVVRGTGRMVKGGSATCRSLAAFSGTPAHRAPRSAAPAHLPSCGNRAPTLGAEQTPHPGNRHQQKDILSHHSCQPAPRPTGQPSLRGCG